MTLLISNGISACLNKCKTKHRQGPIELYVVRDHRPCGRCQAKPPLSRTSQPAWTISPDDSPATYFKLLCRRSQVPSGAWWWNGVIVSRFFFDSRTCSDRSWVCFMLGFLLPISSSLGIKGSTKRCTLQQVDHLERGTKSWDQFPNQARVYLNLL